MDIIEKTIQYEADDFQLAYSTHYRKKYPVRSRLVLIISAISIIAGIVLFIYDMNKGGVFYKNFAAWFLLLYGMVIAIVFVKNMRTIGKRTLSKLPDFSRPLHYVFNIGEIQVSSETINNVNKWEHYQSALFTGDLIMIYPNKYRFNFFPKKYFTDEEFSQLKQWIQAKIKTKEC